MIKILVAHHVEPTVTTAATQFFENLIPVLEKYEQVHMTWLIYSEKKIIKSENNKNSSLIDIHDFNNAMDVVNYVKPDVIFSSFSTNPINYALSLCAKKKNILLIGEYQFDAKIIGNSKKLLFELSKKLLSGELSYEQQNSQKKFLKNFRFIFFKMQFLLKTHFTITNNFFRIFWDLSIFFYSFYLYTKNPNRDVKIGSDIYLVSGKNILKQALESGYPRDKLFLCGNVRFDKIFKNSDFINDQPINKKIRVLLITQPFFEHGWWSRNQRDNFIKKIVGTIYANNSLELIIKIHPSSENYNDYKEIIDKIDPSIKIHQKENLTHLIKNSDIGISFLVSDSTFSYLFSKKPLIFFNAGQYKNDFLVESNLITECTSVDNLNEQIIDCFNNSKTNPKNLESFIEDYFYKSDGFSAERVSQKILQILKKI